MSTVPTLTIYTPTYNRAGLLPRVYEGLCKQTCKDFLWLIIDDGSTDETKKLVEVWTREKKIEIQYFYKENGGVHTARDFAYSICSTELISSCDSDDYLTENAVELWLECWKKKKGKEYIGIFSVAINAEGKRVTPCFPNVMSATYQDFTYKYKCLGEKAAVYRADVLSALPKSPVYEGEKLVGEGYKWIQLPEDKEFILLDEVTRVYDQQEDGYIKGVIGSRFKNPNGFRALYRQHIISNKYLLPRLKGHIGFIAFSLILRDYGFIRKSPKPLVTLMMTPMGIAGYICLLYKREKARNA